MEKLIKKLKRVNNAIQGAKEHYFVVEKSEFYKEFSNEAERNRDLDKIESLKLDYIAQRKEILTQLKEAIEKELSHE